MIIEIVPFLKFRNIIFKPQFVMIANGFELVYFKKFIKKSSFNAVWQLKDKTFLEILYIVVAVTYHQQSNKHNVMDQQH